MAVSLLVPPEQKGILKTAAQKLTEVASIALQGPRSKMGPSRIKGRLRRDQARARTWNLAPHSFPFPHPGARGWRV